MRCCTLALSIALGLAVTGCKPEVVREPYPVYVEIEKPQKLPEELLRPCPIHVQEGRLVEDYVVTAITNTAALRLCAMQVEEIRALQPED